MLARYPVADSQPLLAPLLAVFVAGLLAGLLGIHPRSCLVFTLIGGLASYGPVDLGGVFTVDRYAATLAFSERFYSRAGFAAIADRDVALRSPSTSTRSNTGVPTGTFILRVSSPLLDSSLTDRVRRRCVARSRVLSATLGVRLVPA